MEFHKVTSSTVKYLKSASQATQRTLYYRLYLKQKTASQNIWFNQQCSKHKITPNYVNITTKATSAAAKIAIEKAKQIWIKEETKQWFIRRQNIRIHLYILHSQLASKLHPLEFDMLQDQVREKVSKIIHQKYITQVNKLETLRNKTPTPTNIVPEQFFPRYVNLSDTSFNEKEKEVLNLGPKYTPTVTNTKKQKEMTAVHTELAIQNNLQTIKNPSILKHTLAHKIINSKSRQTRSTQDTTINSIKEKIQKDSLIVTKADKGNTTVIIKEDEYSSKITKCLEEMDLKKLPKDPTNKFYKETKEKINNFQYICTSQKEKRILVPSNYEAPKLYGLIKLHKEDNPIRPVVSYTNAPVSKLSAYLCKEFKSLTNFEPKNTIRNSIELTHRLNQLKVDHSSFKLVSFDVKNMFPNIPPEECFPLVSNILDRHKIIPYIKQEILEGLEFCIGQNYFVYKEDIFLQQSGLPIGSPLSPLLADIFMDSLENNILKSPLAKKNVVFWLRYVDDILLGFKGTNRQLQLLLDYANSLHSKIKFTHEIENNNKSINFLDLTIMRNSNSFSFNIFRKPTYSDATIPYNSYNDMSHKLAAYKSMIHRAFTIPLTKEDQDKELTIIKSIAHNNGYPTNIIDNLIFKKQKNIIQHEIYPKVGNQNEKTYISIPYSGQLSNTVNNIFSKYNITTAFTSQKNVGRILFNAKQHTDIHRNCGVYQLNCPDCNAVYIGETGKSFEIRYSQHVKTHKQTSNFYKHLNESGHTLSAGHKPKILHTCKTYKKRKLLEALEINKMRKNPNHTLLNDQIELNNSPLLNMF